MRKFYLYYLVILAFLAGCVSSGTGRRVDGNTFYSSYPKIVLNISSDLDYIGTRKKEYNAKVLGGGGFGNYTFESYTWRSSKLWLHIGFKQLREPDVEWLGLVDIWKNYTNVQDKGGYCKLEKHTYAYCIFKNRQGVLNKVYVRNASGGKIQVSILLIDRINTKDLKEFEKNCEDVFKPRSSLDAQS